MNEFGTAKNVLLSDNYDRIGGIVMKTFDKFIGFVKKVLSAKIKTDIPYNFYEEQQRFSIDNVSGLYAEKQWKY